MFNWMLGRLRKAVERSFLEGRSCLEGVCSWKSSESESAEQREGKEIKPRSQPNSVFARFSVVCMFNWMLGRSRKAVGRSCLEGRSYVRGKALNLSRLSSAKEKK